MTSSNITPDPDTGIGGWNDEEFYRAGTDGIGRHNESLYPAIPFTSFTKMTRSDVLAVKAYLFSLKPVHAPRVPNDMSFPFDIRWTLVVWRELYFYPGVYEPDPKRSAEWNRDAYLVEGSGHCGECHSPRNIFGGTETQHSLAGGHDGNWLAPNISADPRWGIGNRSVDEIVTFLKTGSQKTEGVAFGPMAEVVHDSLCYVSTTDLQSKAVFLKSGPERAPSVADKVASRSDLKHGQQLHVDNCVKCHQDKGRGFPGVVPNLAANAAITSAQPNDVIDAVLKGLQGIGNHGTMPSFAATLKDQEVVDIVNYIRAGLGNDAPTNATPALVASLRKADSADAAKSEVPNSKPASADPPTNVPASSAGAAAFDCSAIATNETSDVLGNSKEAATLFSVTDTDLGNKIDDMLYRLRKNHPGISFTSLFDTLSAAYCPVVANQTGLANDRKRALMARFSTQLEQRVDAMKAGTGDNIIADVPLAPKVMQRINDPASRKHETPANWMADVLSKAAPAEK